MCTSRIVLAAAVLSMPLPVQAQRMPERTFANASLLIDSTAAQHLGAGDRTHTPRWPFAVAGAIAGGVYAGFRYADAVSKSDGWGGSPLFFSVVIGGGTLGGALGGFVVGHVVRMIRDR